MAKKYALLAIFFGLAGVAVNANQQSNSDNSGYVGAKVCSGCHTKAYQQWQQSDHNKSMQVASKVTVLGDFSNVTVNFHNIQSLLTFKNDTFLIETLYKSGLRKTFAIKYTFGYYPLQQYLVETEDGYLQVLNIAWDSRSKDKGGQRWFYLRPDEKITAEHPFFWTRHFQNWNSRCADCHSTHVEKNYQADTHSYSTTWSEINVSCEGCHGPGGDHVALATGNQLTGANYGSLYKSPTPLRWQFNPGDAIAHPIGEKNPHLINMCGRCHSLRTQLTVHNTGQDFHSINRLQLLNEGSYFIDGQIREEAFVLGSFLQSKMYEEGVTCSNCHNPHSGKVLVEGNNLCSQCHRPQVFDTPEHHHHPVDSEGAACTNCHMPARTFMQIDDRRDHSFTIPSPALSSTLGVPNACTSCHHKEGNQWANKALSTWGVKDNEQHWAQVNQQAQRGDILATGPLANMLNKDTLPDIVRASLLQQLAAIPSVVSAEAAKRNLQDNNPLIRRAAVAALRHMPAEYRWQVLSVHLNDKSRSVRFQLAETLADLVNQLPPVQQMALLKIVGEYRESLMLSEDSPATQISIAHLEMRLGNKDAAEKALLEALRIESNYVPALINLADYYREINAVSKVEPLMKRALKTAPDSGAVQHGYGLFLVRQKKYQEALNFLAAAIQKSDAQPYYSYVYAVALDNQGELNKAITVLVQANQRWPNQYDLLITLIHYLEKAGNTLSINKYLGDLTVIAPNAPAVKQLVKKYGH